MKKWNYFWKWVSRTLIGKIILIWIIIVVFGTIYRFSPNQWDKEWYKAWSLYPVVIGWTILIGFFLVLMGYAIINMFKRK